MANRKSTSRKSTTVVEEPPVRGKSTTRKSKVVEEAPPKKKIMEKAPKEVKKEEVGDETHAMRKNKPVKTSYSTYIQRVLKSVHPEMGITSDGLQTTNNLVKIMCQKIVRNVNILMRVNKKRTINSADISAGIMVSLPGELAKHSVSELSKSVIKYSSSLKTEKADKPVSRSSRAGLTFPISRVQSMMMKHSAGALRKSSGAVVGLTAVLEYVTAEILELSGNYARDDKRSRIKPRDILRAIRSDEELSLLFADVVVGGGIIVDTSGINPTLPVSEEEEPVKKKKKTAKGGNTSKPAKDASKVVKKSRGKKIARKAKK